MVLRLFLMGAVSGLGLSLPSRQDIGRWTSSTCAWVDGKLTSCGLLAREIMPQTPTDALGRPEPAPSQVAATRPEPAAVPVTQPVVADSLPATAVTPAAPATENQPAVAEAEPEVVEVRFAVADDVFANIVNDFVVASSPIIIEPAPKPVAEPADVPLPELVSTEGSAYGDLAYELNRLSEGLEPVAIPSGYARDRPETEIRMVVEEVRESRVRRVATAVRLTGQALSAWVSVLQQGPAVVSAPE